MHCPGYMVDDYISRRIAPAAVLRHKCLNPLIAELNPICNLLALLGVHNFLHVSRIRVKGGINIERDLVWYEHYRVPFSDGCFQVHQVLHSTSLHLLIPVV
jgi:hypothetical protein